MAAFKKLKFGDTRKVTRHAGKGATEQRLPNRSTLNSLTSGAPGSRSMNDYAKATPGANEDTPNFNEFAASTDDYS